MPTKVSYSNDNTAGIIIEITDLKGRTFCIRYHLVAAFSVSSKF